AALTRPGADPDENPPASIPTGDVGRPSRGTTPGVAGRRVHGRTSGTWPEDLRYVLRRLPRDRTRRRGGAGPGRPGVLEEVGRARSRRRGALPPDPNDDA